MLSNYFKMKIKTKKFDDDLLWSMGEIKGKKVIIYGAGEGFIELNQKYCFTEILNIVAIADIKFENNSQNEFNGIRAITPNQILNEDYDVILISNEKTDEILNFIFNTLKIKNKDVRTIFNEEIKDERTNYNYLANFKFEKTLPKLIKNLKNKSVVIYGAGALFALVQKYFDISSLNIIGISDKRFESNNNEYFCGIKAYSTDEIQNLNPDFVVVATKFYIEIIETLTYKTLKGSKIKVRPLVKKPFLTLVKEIFASV